MYEKNRKLAIQLIDPEIVKEIENASLLERKLFIINRELKKMNVEHRERADHIKDIIARARVCHESKTEPVSATVDYSIVNIDTLYDEFHKLYDCDDRGMFLYVYAHLLRHVEIATISMQNTTDTVKDIPTSEKSIEESHSILNHDGVVVNYSEYIKKYDIDMINHSVPISALIYHVNDSCIVTATPICGPRGCSELYIHTYFYLPNHVIPYDIVTVRFSNIRTFTRSINSDELEEVITAYLKQYKFK